MKNINQNKLRRLFTYLSLLIMYELGLYFGSIMGKFWIISFLFTAIISCGILILIEIFGDNQ